MRPTVVLLLATIALGCGQLAPKPSPASQATVPGGDSPARPAPSPTPVADPGPAVEAEPFAVVGAYLDNPVGADAKYKGKKLRVKMLAEKIGQKDGGAYLGCTDATGGAPTFVAFLADPADPNVAALKPWQAVLVEGVCDGRVEDREDRPFRGQTFHVRLSRCRVVATAKDIESLPK